MADYRLHQTGDEIQRILDNATPQSELTAETERATDAENQLQQNINNVQQNLNSEAGSREQADEALQQLIQQVQASLINYYLKTETYSANEINQMLAAIKQFRYQVVDQLPTPSAETMGIIYLVPSAHAVSGNIKDEFITLTRDEGSGIIYYFEQIGETAIDLSNYYTKAQTNAEITNALNTALANYSTTQQMSAAIATAIANYYTKAQVDAMIAPFITASVNNLVNYYLKSETFNKTEVQQMIAAVKQFRYQVATELPTASADTVGIIYLIPSTNPQQKNVKDEFITIATTEQGSTTYSWEQIGSTEVDLSGYSTTEQMNAAIASAITAALAPYYTAEQVNAAISTALNAYYTSQQTDAAITNTLNTALADYSTTQQMNTAIATAIVNYYTKTQVDALIADFITASVNNLVNYYLKSDTYSKDEVNQLIGELSSLRFEVADSLPEATAATLGAIYLVPGSSPTIQNIKDEYITLKRTEGGVDTYYWELIGSTAVDLSNYFTKAQTNAAITAALNAALADYSTTQQMNAAIAAAIADYYTKQEVDALIANFITASVNNLVNYYLKSDTYTKSEVQQLIAAVKQFTYQIVATLPTASADTMNIIYLVPSADPKTQNVKDEYITIATTEQDVTTYAWEKIGSTDIDLSGYYTSQQTDAAISTALASYYTKTQTDTAITTALNTALADYSTTQQMATAIATALVSYYTKTEIDNLIANFITKSVDDLVNYYLKSDTYTKSEVQQLISAVKQFTYQSVQSLPTASADTMNIIYLVPSSDPQTQNVKDEYITIATTEQDVTTYSWEKIGSTDIDLSGYYTSQQTDAAIIAALTAALADYSTTQQMTTAINTAVAGKQNIITDGAIIGLGYGVCSTAAATQAKEVTIANFLLLANMPITVKFTNAITVANATLNISMTGAKPLYMDGTALNPYVVMAGMTATIIYDGTNYNIVHLGYLKNIANPNVVDMGLPSGTLWAKKNIDITQSDGFAASEFQYECSFFSFGNIAGHNPISDSAFSYDFGSANTGPYASTPGSQLSGNVPVNPMYDIARAICGDPWRLPTATEFQELIDNCDFVQADGETVVSGTNKSVTVNGIVGIYLKSKTNGNYLFFPCSGRGDGASWDYRGSSGNYWSGSLASATYGLFLDFFSGGVYPQHSYYRFLGFSGRAVQHVVQPSE